MERKNRRSIQKILSSNFILLSAILTLTTSLLFSIRQYYQLKENAIESLDNTCISIGDNIAQQISGMDTVALNAISSSALRRDFIQYQNEDNTDYVRNQYRLELAGGLTTAKGFDFTIRQLNIYNTDSGGYGAGLYNGSFHFPSSSQHWYQGTMEANGGRCVYAPLPDTFLSDKGGMQADQQYVSLCRLFFDSTLMPAGIIEVKKYYQDVFRSAYSSVSPYDEQIFVYDSTGRQLFPLAGSTKDTFDYFSIASDSDTDLLNSVTGKKVHTTCYQPEDSGLTTIISVENSKFMAPILQSNNWILVLFLVLFGFSLIIANYLSRKISTPIRNIYHFLENEKQDEYATIKMKDTNIREIDKLRDAINESIRNRKETTQTLMVLKEQEVQAEMLALQSQMNPHFLYNSLSTIAEMAEEGMTEQVSQMCSDITEILRYISSNKEQTTTIEEELELCSLYLNCMKLRYKRELTYTFRIQNDDMLDFRIPKLCIQLLVENAIKSVTTRTPPWKVEVVGWVDATGWYLTVKDNGPGFDPDVECALSDQMAEILDKGLLPRLQINGMGLLNIFIRHYLLLGNGFYFDFGTRAEGGAYVTIGGKPH